MPTDNIARHVTNALQHATKRLAEMFQVALIFEYAFIKYWMHARWCWFQLALIFRYAFIKYWMHARWCWFQVALIFEYAFIKYWMHARWCRFQVALIFEYAFFATCGLRLVGYQCKCKYALKRIATRKHNVAHHQKASWNVSGSLNIWICFFCDLRLATCG